MQWVYEKALERAKKFNIEGVTYNLTLGVVKRVIPAVASTNAIIASSCALEALKTLTKFSKPLNTYMLYNGRSGASAEATLGEKRSDCMVCASLVKELKVNADMKLKELIDLYILKQVELEILICEANDNRAKWEFV